MVHEQVHHEKRRTPGDNPFDYPNNIIEQYAYIAQFKHLKEKGYTIKDIQDETQFPTLSIKFKKYPKELKKYWNMA